MKRSSIVVGDMQLTTDYREILRDEFQRRLGRNERYSLRSFARDLNISPTSLSLILGNRQGLSTHTAQKITARLGLDDDFKKLFMVSVKSQHSRIRRERALAKAELNKIRSQPGEYKMPAGAFEKIGPWYHFAIVECVRARPEITAKQLSRILELDLNLIERALLQLIETKVLARRNNAWRVKAEIVSASSKVPSRALRDFHHGVIKKANAAIELQSVNERDLASIFFAFSVEKLSEIQSEMRAFRRRLVKKYSVKKDSKQEIYCLSQQFFRITKGLENEENSSLS